MSITTILVSIEQVNTPLVLALKYKNYYRAIESNQFEIKTHSDGGTKLTALDSGEIQLRDSNGQDNQIWFFESHILKNKSQPSKVKFPRTLVERRTS